jgi:integrase
MCGLRRSEIFGLSWSDIDFENKTISIKQAAVPVDKEINLKKTKNKTSTRTFVYPDCLHEIFKAKRGIGPVCPSKLGKIENGGNYSHRFKNLIDKYKLKPIRFHDLRHFNATMMLQNGISDKVAALEAYTSMSCRTWILMQPKN